MGQTLSENTSLEQLLLFANLPGSAPNPLLSELVWLKMQGGLLEQRQVNLAQQRVRVQERIQTLVQQLQR